ncbi:50S ribosomal protein L25/general stress protein Ctc [Candidatus Endobugula sertula]|uniref:Large ribosomal subunit protein bL25 n=1 Tax=Candidatus Endobugula sertula TaxID=62101 RepID=A0A1D2QMY9_9GAMM|nr:50S ribosomal protein L25/general stress protein Ctc [Candidatus Endobugula sertula]
MSNKDFVLDAQSREEVGKGASRRLRRDSGLVPAIVYGSSKKPQMISIKHKELVKHLDHEAFYSHIISLNVDGTAQDVILKDLQRHPAKAQILHADFLRVSKTKKITTRVPLHFINESSSKGVKMQGGLVSHSLTELEINCLPGDLPEFIEVDLADVEIGHIVHISDLTLPQGVESVALIHGADHDLPVATINKPKGASEDTHSEEESEE